MTYKRGDVVVVPFPNSDGKTYKPRPVLIVDADNVRRQYDDNVAVMVTSVPRTDQGSVAIPLSDVRAKPMGLLSDSWVVAYQIATFTDSQIRKSIGFCPNMADIDDALRLTFGV